MDSLLNLFVQHPLRILGLAAAYLALWGIARVAGNTSNALLAPACFGAAFAAWEWLVMTRSPEANIRVDLLAIWPALGLATAWALYRTFARR